MDSINIRDPFVLLFDGHYYMYGTRGQTTWGLADGFDCYVSDDLTQWSEPIEVFHNSGDFWADRCYWAPECYFYHDSFYLFATFKSETSCLRMQVLKSDSPTGPFLPYSDGPITPADWDCLDGTVYFDRAGVPFLVFSHSFQQNPKGEMCAAKLKPDLSGLTGEIKVLFTAADAPWPVPFPNAKQVFGVDHDIYLSDGPCLHRTAKGRLIMLWSSFGPKGYAVGLAASDNDEIDGNWIHHDHLLFEENGGHGMIFRSKQGELIFTLHYPNDKYCERPLFVKILEEKDTIRIS